jgi:hypothetical protein
VSAIANIALWMAEGRSDSPGAVGGILIVLGIVATLAALAFLGHLLIDRLGQTKRKSLERDPQEPGRVGTVGKQEGP